MIGLFESLTLIFAVVALAIIALMLVTIGVYVIRRDRHIKRTVAIENAAKSLWVSGEIDDMLHWYVMQHNRAKRGDHAPR